MGFLPIESLPQLKEYCENFIRSNDRYSLVSASFHVKEYACGAVRKATDSSQGLVPKYLSEIFLSVDKPVDGCEFLGMAICACVSRKIIYDYTRIDCSECGEFIGTGEPSAWHRIDYCEKCKAVTADA